MHKDEWSFHRHFVHLPNIEKDVVIIGNGEKAEIWNKEAWDEINNEESLNMDEIADKLDELDFRI